MRKRKAFARQIFSLTAALFLSQSVALQGYDLALAKAAECAVGVNVNSFQNFSADEQEAIVQQLKKSRVRFVRTSLRPDDKNMNLAKRLQDEGIGLVLVASPQCKPGTKQRPGWDVTHIRPAMPLSASDPERSREYFQGVFDKLDAKGIVLAGVEIGNELNWADFNGDFPAPGKGVAFNFNDLSHDPEAKQIARGFLQYLKVLKAIKEVRDNSKLNKNTPIISAGMAAVSGGPWQAKSKFDGVTIPATYAFLRDHGLDDLVDGYGVHDYPGVVKEGDKTALDKRNLKLDQTVFSGNTKPYWVTEWGFPTNENSPDAEKTRERSVTEMREYFQRLRKQGRLGGIFWYVWNQPDKCSIYRDGQILEAGRRATKPM